MKKIFLLLFSAILISTSTVAQYGYLRASVGYSWNAFQKTGQVLGFRPGPGFEATDPANSLIIPLLNQNLSDNSGGKYISTINDGYARGVNTSLYGGYMINPYFGVEIGFTYLAGAKISSQMIYDDLNPDSTVLVLGKSVVVNTQTSSAGFSLMPGFFIRAAKPDAKFAPTARFGLSIPFAGATYHDLNVDAPNAGNNIFDIPSSTSIRVKTESTFSIGFNGGIGISYTPIPLIQIGAEVNGQYLFVKPQNSTIEKYVLVNDGVENDRLSGSSPLSVYSTQTEFVNKLDENSNTTKFGKGRKSTNDPSCVNCVDESKPRQELRTSANFSTIGFNIGITFNLSKKIFANPTGKKRAE
jgi:hypothetical protein